MAKSTGDTRSSFGCFFVYILKYTYKQGVYLSTAQERRAGTERFSIVSEWRHVDDAAAGGATYGKRKYAGSASLVRALYLSAD